jgi:type VI protein secretion system component Hcp
MEQNTTDLVMKFVLDQQPVWAECALEVAPNDTLMTDFLKNTDYDNYSNFFEVTNFDFNIALKDSGESTNVLGGQPARNHQPQQQPKPGFNNTFAKWRSATSAESKSIYYPLEFDQFNFKRIIDRASPTFFKCCCESRSFDSAVLVKRLGQGDISGKQNVSVGYLRIDFTKVLITGVNWDDGDLVTESCEFICQGMKVIYRRQKASGIVAGGVGNEFSATWPNPNKDRTLGIRDGGRG